MKHKIPESQLNRIVKESVKGVINELDWKTYANAAKKRLQQYRDSNHKDEEKFDKYWELQKAANQSFDDDYVGLMKYDTIGDKMKGKHSPKFDGKIDVSRENMPYSAIKGYNKSGNELFSTDKGIYHSFNGITTPKNFFRDAEVSDAYTRANDDLWDYNNGNYAYDNEKGWHLKESENSACGKYVNPNYNNNDNKKRNMKKRVKLTEAQLNRIIKESVNQILKEGLWNAIEKDNYQVYDAFVDFIKNYYAKGDDIKAYEIEDEVNDWMVKMMDDLDNKYGENI